MMFVIKEVKVKIKMAVVAEILRDFHRMVWNTRARKPTLKELRIYEFGLLIDKKDSRVMEFIIFE